MSKNEGLELPPLGPDSNPVIPTEFISEAMREEATKMGGRALRQEVASTILTTTIDTPSLRALSDLEDRDPDSIRRIHDRAFTMYNNNLNHQHKVEKRLARRRRIYQEIGVAFRLAGVGLAAANLILPGDADTLIKNNDNSQTDE